MFINRRLIDYILVLAVLAIVILAWAFLLYTAHFTGIQFLENRFGPVPTILPPYLQNV